MPKRSTFTTTTALPADVTRSAVLDFLHSHAGMIDLNPLVVERHVLGRPPAHCPADEARCEWWSVTDRISYLPGGKNNNNNNNTSSASASTSLLSTKVTYSAAFHDMPDGVQTHSYAPMGTHIRSRWRLGGTLPGERRQVVELGIGAPSRGLYIREDVELSCNFIMAGFVKKTLKRAHGTLVEALIAKARRGQRQRERESSSTSSRDDKDEDVPDGGPAAQPPQQHRQHTSSASAPASGEDPGRGGARCPPADSLGSDSNSESRHSDSNSESRHSDSRHSAVAPRRYPHGTSTAPAPAPAPAPAQHRQYGAAYAAVPRPRRGQQPATGTAPARGGPWAHEGGGYDVRLPPPEGRVLVSEME